MRKVLRNNHKAKRLNGTSKGRIGTFLGLMDKHKNFLVVGDFIAVCEYNGDIVAVKCDNEMSGIYPDYDTAQPIIMGWLYSLYFLMRILKGD